MPDEIASDIDLDLSDIDMSEDITLKKAGKIIQDALLEEISQCTPYCRVEATISCRFDAIMYLPDQTKMFAENSNSPLYCIHLKGKTRCYEKYLALYKECQIDHKEQLKIREERNLGYNETPQYRYEGVEYTEDKDLMKSDFKKQIKCEPNGCELYQKQIQNSIDAHKRWGFMNGLHVFEIKSNKDKFDLLQHQIPNMAAVADYVWLVLGDEMKIPEWLPPYVGVMVYHSDTKKFTITRKREIKIDNPPMYWQALQGSGYKIKNEQLYAFARLIHKWHINSMFHFMFQSKPCIDMTEDIKELIAFVKVNEKKTMAELQKSLFDFDGGEE